MPITEYSLSLIDDYIKQLDSEVSNLFHTLEEELPEKQFRMYEKMLDRATYLIGQIEEELK